MYLDPRAMVLPPALAVATVAGACACSVMALQLAWLPARAFRLLRHAHQKRRRMRIARALAALRHDREYLLGRLPPTASAQVLSLLDRASLSALRRTCRQAYLLVGAATTHVALDARGLRRTTTLPLEGVWPQLQGVSLQLGPLEEEPGLWAPTPRAPLATVPLQAGHEPTTTTAAGTAGTGVTWDPSLSSRVADGVLRAMLTHCGLDGLQRLRRVDLSGCSAGLSADTWGALAAALPHTGVTVLAPLRSLLGSDSTSYTARSSAALNQILPALTRVAAHAGRGVRLHVVGGSCRISSQRELRTLAACASAVVCGISLADAYMYSGALTWQDLAPCTALRHLTVVPGTRASMQQLLSALHLLPGLQSLALGPCPRLPLGVAELAALQQLTHVTNLMLDTITLPARPRHPTPGLPTTHSPAATSPLPSLAHLQSLSVLHLDISEGRMPVQLARLAPQLTRLALGVCPASHAAALAGLTASEAAAATAAVTTAVAAAGEVAAVVEVAAAAAAAEPQGAGVHAGMGVQIGADVQMGGGVWQAPAPAGVNGAQPLQAPATKHKWLALLQDLSHLSELHLGGAAAAVLARELSSVAAAATTAAAAQPLAPAPAAPAAAAARQSNSGTGLAAAAAAAAAAPVPGVPLGDVRLLSLRSYSLHHVPDLLQLQQLLLLLHGAPGVRHVALHHVCGSGRGRAADAWRGRSVIWGPLEPQGPEEVMQQLQNVSSLTHLTLQGGGFGLCHSLAHVRMPVSSLTLDGMGMLTDDDVCDIAALQTSMLQPGTVTEGETGHHGMLQRLRVLHCRQINGPELEARIGSVNLQIECTDWRSVDQNLTHQ